MSADSSTSGDTARGGAAAEATATTSEKQVVILDARPILADGGEPFGAIMEAAQKVEPGGELHVWAPFEPVPLQGVLGEQGFNYSSREDSPGNWLTVFSREND